MPKVRCREIKGFSPVVEINAGGLKFYVYKGEEDYVVDDDFCTCKSFVMNLARGRLEGCKHICSNKKVVKSLEVEREEAYDIIFSIIVYGKSSLLRYLEKEGR